MMNQGKDHRLRNIKKLTEIFARDDLKTESKMKIWSRLYAHSGFFQVKQKVVIATLEPSIDYPAGNCMFKVNNRNTRTRCEICSKLTIKTPERRLASFWCLYC